MRGKVSKFMGSSIRLRVRRFLMKIVIPSKLISRRNRVRILSRFKGFDIAEKGCSVAYGCSFFDGDRRQEVKLCSGVDIRENCVFYIGRLAVGSNTFIGRDCFFHCRLFQCGNEPGTVTIGNGCEIAPKVTFLCGTHAFGGSEHRAGAPSTKGISVGNGVWIGSNATILPGCSIGNGSVVGAGSVVTKDVEPNTVVAGNPARVIRRLD